MNLNPRWKQEIQDTGYTIFPGLVSAEKIAEARAAIEKDLRTDYDVTRQSEYDSVSYCPAIRGSIAIRNLLEATPIKNLLDEIFGIKNINWNDGQIAIRLADSGTTERPPESHIDGFATPTNQLEFRRIYNHTVLVGIYLTPVRRPFAGNFTVWPGSHHKHEQYFRERGPQAMREPMPQLELGEPVQLTCEPGDVVLAHYALGHSAAANTADIDRIAVYFRVGLNAIDQDQWHYLTNMWSGWKL